MLTTTVLAMLTIARSPGGTTAARCSGADPAIVSASVKSVTHQGGVNRYHLSATVTNLGSSKQPSNVVQSVDVYQNGIKVDAHGVPPLRRNATYAVTHDYLRATDAGEGTTPFRFVLHVHQPPVPGPADCNLDNDSYDLTV
jgi:hypothetical protein